MFANQRLFMLFGATERGEIVGCPDISEHDADVAQQPAPFHAQNRTLRKAPLEFSLGNFEQGVKRIAALIFELGEKTRFPCRARKPVPGTDVEAFVAAVN